MAEWKKVLVSGSAADVTSLKLASVVNASTDTDKFLVLDSSGNVDFRTGTEVRSDIGAGAGSGDIAAVNITAGSGLDGSVNTSTGTHTQTLNLDIDGLTDIGAALVDADILAVDDGAAGTNRKATMARLKTYMQNGLTFTTNTNTFRRVDVFDGTDTITLGSVETLTLKQGNNVTLSEADGTITIASTDTNTTYSVGDGGLTQNNFTNADHTKLNGIATNANNYVLPEATATAKGGIELFSNTDQTVAANTVSSTANRTYGLQLNSAGQAVVNVPWSDTNTDTDTIRTIRTQHGDTATSLENDESLILKSGTNVTISETAGTVTISSTDTNTTYSVGDGGLTQNNFTNADHTKLNGIATSANNYSLTIADVKSVLGGGMPSNALTIGDSGDTITIAGNLDVNGTTTTIDTTNLAVADKFIELNRGASTNGDGGIVINGAVNRSFGWDDSADRWAFDFTGATAGQTTITSDAFAAAVVVGGGTGIAEVNANYAKSGNMYVNTNEDDIYIYVA